MKILRTEIHSAPDNVWTKVYLRDTCNEYEVVFDTQPNFSYMPHIDLYNDSECFYDTFELTHYTVARLGWYGIESSDATYFKTNRRRYVCSNDEIIDWLFDKKTITYHFTLISVVMYGI